VPIIIPTTLPNAQTVKTLVQEFCERTGIKVPSTVISSVDPQVRQIVGLLNEEIEELCEGPPLQVMLAEFSFSAIAAEEQGQVESLVGEPYRAILNDVLWNRTAKTKLVGPLSPQDFQAQKAFGTSGPTGQYRIRGDRLYILPTPTAGDTIAGEIIRRYAVIPDGGTLPTKERCTADNDTFIIPYRLLMAGLRWRWKREKALRYAEDKERYNLMVGNYLIKSGTKRVLSMDGGSGDVKPGIFVPAGNWTP